MGKFIVHNYFKGQEPQKRKIEVIKILIKILENKK